MLNTADGKGPRSAGVQFSDAVTEAQRVTLGKMSKIILGLAQKVVTRAVSESDLETLDRVARRLVLEAARQAVADKLR